MLANSLDKRWFVGQPTLDKRPVYLRRQFPANVGQQTNKPTCVGLLANRAVYLYRDYRPTVGQQTNKPTVLANKPTMLANRQSDWLFSKFHEIVGQQTI